MARPAFSCLWLGLLVVLLSSCVSAPPPAGRVAPVFRSETATQPLEKMAQQGRYLDAALAYSRLANDAEPPLRDEYSLRAAELLKEGNYIPQSFQLLNEIQAQDQGPEFLIRRALLTADIALARQLPDEALTVLDGIGPQLAEDEHDFRRRYHRLRASAFEQQENPLENARERVLLEPLLDKPEAVQENQTAILAALQQLSPQALTELPLADELSGWLELALIGRGGDDSTTSSALIDQWREVYPSHPASDETIAALLASRPHALRTPEHIALILPLGAQNRFARAAEAVRNGFLAAYYLSTESLSTESLAAESAKTGSAQTDEPPPTGADGLTEIQPDIADTTSPHIIPTLRIYDEGRSTEEFAATYQHAIDEGADLVVGPLGKNAVDQLAKQASLATPVLALNYSDVKNDNPPRDLFQLGLSPEQEARAVADRAWLDGYGRAAVITPATAWGDRVAKAFNERWLQLNGHVVDVQHYNPKENDYSKPIRRLLNVDESQARRNSVRRMTGEKVEFIPRRRQDIDFIFMVAYARQARLIRPQLRFHHAPNIPVYTTSHAFSGHIDAQMDRDMDGVIFAGMPWTLAPSAADQRLKTDIGKAWPASAQRYTRLHALGVDAYQLIDQLNELRRDRTRHYAGASGQLSLDMANQLQRQLLWARFERGIPQQMDLPDATD